MHVRTLLTCVVTWSEMVLCCGCNRTGSCRGCACVKAGKQCSNCLPSKLGSCSNVSSTPIPSMATPTVNQSATNRTMPKQPLCLVWICYECSEREWSDWCSRYFSYSYSAAGFYFMATMPTSASDLPTNEYACVRSTMLMTLLMTFLMHWKQPTLR